MKKSECETAIRALCHQWRAQFHPNTGEQDLPFSDFHRWLMNNHPSLLNFRSVTPAADEAERWFDQEFKQTWRN